MDDESYTQLEKNLRSLNLSRRSAIFLAQYTQLYTPLTVIEPPLVANDSLMSGMPAEGVGTAGPVDDSAVADTLED